LIYYRTRPPISPVPTEMTKDFNIAVAEFLVLDLQGNPISTDDGQKLSGFIFDEMSKEFNQMTTEITPEIWNYTLTGTVAGTTPEERHQNAQTLAEKINASVVVYGAIIKDGEGATFSPEFYVNYQGFSNNAPEILGGNQLGRSLDINLPFDRSKDTTGGNPRLVARTQALGLLTLGLAYYSNDDYETAVKYFDQAINIEDWLSSAGKDIAYILRGNTLTRLAYKNSDYSQLALPLADYETAWKLTKQTNARALIGIGGIYYLEATTSDKVDADKLDQAESVFMEALNLPNQPESYNIEAKAHFRPAQFCWMTRGCSIKLRRNTFWSSLNTKKGIWRSGNLHRSPMRAWGCRPCEKGSFCLQLNGTKRPWKRQVPNSRRNIPAASALFTSSLALKKAEKETRNWLVNIL
jgi:tetratricopeptide (TPR) repeat protein